MHKLTLLFVPMLLTGCASWQQPAYINVTANTMASSPPVAFSQGPMPPAPAVDPNNPSLQNTTAAVQAPVDLSRVAPPAESSAPNNVTLEPIQTPGPMVNGQYSSLWDVIRSGFTLNHYYGNASVQTWINFYTKDPNLIENITTQATPYLYIIVQELQARDMPTELALLPIVESGFQPKGRSWCGAVGLWQLMPGTAKDLGTGEENRWYNARESIQGSTAAALNYLKYLYNYFNGDWMLALSAYDSGPGTVQNAINNNTAAGLPTDFWDLHLPAETENYAPKLMALAIIINDPAQYGIVLPNIPNRPLLGTAAIPEQMSLSQAAKFADIGEEELKRLNPAFTKNVTPPTFLGSFTLNLPISKVSTFEQNCAANPGVTGLERYTLATVNAKNFGTYRVRPGETLDTVSRFTGVPTPTLKSYNHLHSNLIHSGQVLRYPIDTTAAYHYITYHVKPGDTLSRIASHYHVSLFDLMQWNNLNNKSRLHTGERLVIRQKISY